MRRHRGVACERRSRVVGKTTETEALAPFFLSSDKRSQQLQDARRGEMVGQAKDRAGEARVQVCRPRVSKLDSFGRKARDKSGDTLPVGWLPYDHFRVHLRNECPPSALARLLYVASLLRVRWVALRRRPFRLPCITVALSAPRHPTPQIDGRGHLAGRLASVMAKELLLGAWPCPLAASARSGCGSARRRRALRARRRRRGGRQPPSPPLPRRRARAAPSPAAGSHIVLVRSEELCISGNIHRNKQKWAEAANKKSNTNPT